MTWALDEHWFTEAKVIGKLPGGSLGPWDLVLRKLGAAHCVARWSAGDERVVGAWYCCPGGTVANGDNRPYASALEAVTYGAMMGYWG